MNHDSEYFERKLKFRFEYVKSLIGLSSTHPHLMISVYRSLYNYQEVHEGLPEAICGQSNKIPLEHLVQLTGSVWHCTFGQCVNFSKFFNQ